MFTFSRSELVRGFLLHAPRNLLLSLSALKIQNEITYVSMYSAAFLTNFLAYPFLTIQRRLECRSAMPTGMFPNDSFGKGSIIKCFREAMKETGGVRNLWKGFSAHFLTVVILLSALPTVSDYMMQVMGPIERRLLKNEQNGQMTTL